MASYSRQQDYFCVHCGLFFNCTIKYSLNSYFYTLIRQITPKCIFVSFGSQSRFIVLLPQKSKLIVCCWIVRIICNCINVLSGLMAKWAEIKAAAILVFLFFHLQMFLKVCKLALYTVTGGLKKSIKLYNKRLKHLQQLHVLFGPLSFSSLPLFSHFARHD